MNRITGPVAILDRIAMADLARRVDEGEALRTIARRDGCTVWRIRSMCSSARLTSPTRHRSREERRKALAFYARSGLPVGKAAAALQIPRSTLHRWIQEDRRDAVDSVDEVGYQRTAWRCPKHGRVALRPCPACLALQARRQSYQPPTSSRSAVAAAG